MLQKIEKPFNFIIFGASGDLAQLKIFPAIYEMAIQKRFPARYSIVGYARSKMTNDEFREHFKKSIKTHIDKYIYDEKVVDDLLKHVYYQTGQYDDAGDFDLLAEHLLTLQDGNKVLNLAFFSIQPSVFEPITENLGKIKKKLGSNVQLMIEKPFGHDRDSAGKLFQLITDHFDKNDLFLIDHYLGKAPVQSILPLRYNNRILNLLLKGNEIANIQISALETDGVEERVGFFDQVGTLKDMVQSHLLQILALLTMSMPVNQDVKSIRREKGNILSALRYEEDNCGIIFGQYDSYKKLAGVKKDSKTPTFVAFRCTMDLTGWYQVPIYIRTGKRLGHKHTYIVIEFKKPIFYKAAEVEANRLIIELYPQERIQIRLINNEGKEYDKSHVVSGESLACIGDNCLPPYGRLILDAFLKRYTSFLSIDEILASWHFIDEIMACSEKRGNTVNRYGDDTNGPKEHLDLTKEDNFTWYDTDRL